MLNQVSATELLMRLNDREYLNILDVRTPVEYHSYNIGGLNVPLNTLEAALREFAYNKSDEIIVICSAGLRSETAAKLLTAKGYQNIKNLTGGLLALQKIRS
jgi:rhodanese-related sulfurtransferase